MKRKERKKIIRFFFRLLVWGGAFSFLAYIFLFGDYGYLARRKLSIQVSQLEKEIEVFKEQNKNLAQEIEALKNDPQIIERIARERLGLIKEGEIKYKFIK
ncbi:Cell division protein FtsB [subsurface metagenome]